MTKAEELARNKAAYIVDNHPALLGVNPAASELKGLLAASIGMALQEYGRLVQEAAAKAIEETCFYDEYAGLTANDLAESIRDRPLP